MLRTEYEGRFHVRLTDGLAALPGPAGERSATVFQHGTLETKIYVPQGIDEQTPHDRDEVYIVVSGEGRFTLAGRTEAFGPGAFLFAPAGVKHRFAEFTDDFVAWVLFYGPEGGEWLLDQAE